MINNKAIGLFDSGTGGLSVLQAIAKLLPNENFVYLGDTAHFPYGNKTERAITQFSLDNMTWLLNFPVKMIVVACNTASVIAGKELKARCPVPVMTMADIPQRVRGCNVGLIGTKHSVAGSLYPIAKTRKACPNLASLVEQGNLFSEETEQEVANSLVGLEDVDTLILGCTHYHFLSPVIAQHTKAKLFDPAPMVAQRVKSVLANKGLLSAKRQGSIEYYYTK